MKITKKKRPFLKGGMWNVFCGIFFLKNFQIYKNIPHFRDGLRKYRNEGALKQAINKLKINFEDQVLNKRWKIQIS